ncbi:MAG: HAD-IA family hydrolase [Candidatus Micrarchaeota archaeon]
MAIARKLSKKYKIIMLSNNNKQTVAALRKKHAKMLAIFDEIYFSFELKTRKPEEKIYKIMLRKSHLVPENCIFIDDVIVNLKTAKKLGINAIQFKNEAQLKQELKRLGVVVN